MGMKELAPKDIILPEIVSRILAARGLVEPRDVQAFIEPDYESSLHDPFLLKDMHLAVERILGAIKDNQKIVVYGDYDIDGMTATALMEEVLAGLGAEVSTYIPDRFEEGYGINLGSLKNLHRKGVGLVVSVDCGITAIKEVEWAKANGLDMVITDHHTVPEQLPQGVPILNPKQKDDTYPFKDLAGVGVAFKLAQALQLKSGEPERGQEKWLLDLVALGTSCDMVSMVGENRALVKYGLIVLAKTRRIGLKALAMAAGLKLEKVQSYHLGFILGPRLNAAGRLEHAQQSLNLLTTRNSSEAFTIAEQLDDLNRQRRLEQDRIFKQALVAAEGCRDDAVLVLSSDDWSHGIVGVVASKLLERLHKPVILLQVMGATAKGSGRSTAELNLVEALSNCAQLLTKYGGHHFAAGLTLASSNIDELRAGLNQYYQEKGLTPAERQPLSQADIDIEDLEDINWPLFEALAMLEPYGTGNPQPLFVSHHLKLVNVAAIGKSKEHLKLVVADKKGKTMEAIAFSQADRHPNLKSGQHLDVCYQIGANEYMDRKSLQLIVVELR